MIVIGLGTGGIKSNVSPLIAEQYRGTRQKIKTLKSGERVILDPAITILRIYMVRTARRRLRGGDADLVDRSSTSVSMLAPLAQSPLPS